MLPLSALDDACIMNDDNGNNPFLHHSTRQSRFLGTLASSSYQRHSNHHQLEASNTAAQSLYSDIDSSNSNAPAYIPPPPPKYTPYNNSNLHLLASSTRQSNSDSDSHRSATHSSTQVKNRTWADIWEDIEKAEHIEQARHNAGPQQPRRQYQQDLDHHHPAGISSQARAQRRQSHTSHHVQFASATSTSERTGQEKKSNRVVRTLRKYLPLPGSTTSAAIFTGSASIQQHEQASRRISPIDTSRFASSSSSSSSHPPPYHIHNNTAKPRAAYASLDQTKQSMSANLYKSTPIRLLAYAILFFNTLLVIKVMADPSLGGSGGGFGTGTGYAGNGQSGEQIRLGNGKGIIKGVDLEKRFPCVMATSHNDEMQAAPFVSPINILSFCLYIAKIYLQKAYGYPCVT